MNYRAALTRVSKNAKTGPIPVSTTESSTCPKTCGQYETCYAKYGNPVVHWNKISRGERGKDWEDFCADVWALPSGSLWRHNVAGDLPGDGVDIDAEALDLLVEANKRKRGFTFTHYPLTERNVELMEKAAARGLTINVSCDTLNDIAEAKKRTVLPVVVVLPSTTEAHSLRTDDGVKIVVCPATYRDDKTCSNCGLCYVQDRSVIGFPAHGVKKFTIDRRMK